MPEAIDMFRVGEAAKVLRVSVKTLHRWDESGRLKALRTKSDHRYYLRDQLSEFMQSVGKLRYERTPKNMQEISE